MFGANGAGGGGGASAYASGPAIGGAGGAGLVIVTEYCWADSADDCCIPAPCPGAARVPWTGQGVPQGWPQLDYTGEG